MQCLAERNGDFCTPDGCSSRGFALIYSNDDFIHVCAPSLASPTALRRVQGDTLPHHAARGIQEALEASSLSWIWGIQGGRCDTRALVLIRDSLTPAQVDASGCAVVAGDWYSPYDDLTWSDPTELEVDHVVALKEAWDSGAWNWNDERRSKFGNDLEDARSLLAVTSSENQSKGADDPSNWIPPNDDYVCTYLPDWISIKARWELSMDESEHGRVQNLLSDRCPEQLVAP
jgi:hypothetical protein